MKYLILLILVACGSVVGYQISVSDQDKANVYDPHVLPIDKDSNGVDDSVDKWIKKKTKDQNLQDALTQYARHLEKQFIIFNTEEMKEGGSVENSLQKYGKSYWYSVGEYKKKLVGKYMADQLKHERCITYVMVDVEEAIKLQNEIVKYLVNTTHKRRKYFSRWVRAARPQVANDPNLTPNEDDFKHCEFEVVGNELIQAKINKSFDGHYVDGDLEPSSIFSGINNVWVGMASWYKGYASGGIIPYWGGESDPIGDDVDRDLIRDDMERYINASYDDYNVRMYLRGELKEKYMILISNGKCEKVNQIKLDQEDLRDCRLFAISHMTSEEHNEIHDVGSYLGSKILTNDNFGQMYGKCLGGIKYRAKKLKSVCECPTECKKKIKSSTYIDEICLQSTRI